MIFSLVVSLFKSENKLCYQLYIMLSLTDYQRIVKNLIDLQFRRNLLWS